jgi:hypothetical protein
MHYCHTPPHQSLEETWALITSLIEGPVRAWVFVPRFKETAAIGLIYFLNNSPTPSMGYILSSRYWRNSLMSGAVKEIVRFGFETLQLDRIELWIHAVVDTIGLPVHLGLTPREAHDNRLCSVLLSGLRPRTMLLADRGYDAD